MATAYPEVDTDILNCSICLEKFNNPKYLPCLHTFCESCLQSYIVSTVKQTEKNGDSFTCPICRIAVKSPDSKSSVEKWAEQMPNNHLIVSLLGGCSRKDENSKRNCDPCKLSNETTDAIYWCIECMEALCDICYSVHKRLKVSKHHEVVSISEIDKYPLKMAETDEPCLEHREKVFEVFCLDHGSLCCVICLATKHRECKNIKTIDEMSEKVMESDLSKFEEQLEDSINKTAIMVNNKQKNIDDIDKKYIDLLGEMTGTVAEAKTRLEQLLGKFKCDLEQLHKPQKQNLVDRKERIESFQKTAVNGLKLIQTVSGQGTNKQLFLSAEKVKSQLSSHIMQLQSELSDDGKVDYTMKVDENLRSIGTVMNSVAKVTVKMSNSQSEIKQVITSVKSLQILPQENIQAGIMDLEAVCVAEIRSDESDFTGGAFLDKNRIAFVDYRGNKLKLYDMTGSLLNRVIIDENPWNVVSISAEDVLVSFELTYARYRYRISPNQIYKFPNQKLQRGTGNGLSISKQDTLCVAGKSKVVIENERDGIKHSFQRFFQDNATFVASSVDKVFFIDANSLVCCSIEGKEIFRHQHSDLKGARGIAVDSDTNVYICVPTKGYIYLVSNDGSRGRKFISAFGDMKKPYAIGFDKEGGQFFVTSDGEKSTAKLFKLLRIG